MNRVIRILFSQGAKRMLSASCLSVAAIVLGAGTRLDWLETPEHAFVVMPANLITDANVQRAVWSPNGAYLLVEAVPTVRTTIEQILNFTPAPGARQLQIQRAGPMLLSWDRATQTVRKIWSTDDPNVQVASVDWLSGSGTAYVTLIGQSIENEKTETFCGVLAVDAGTGHYSWVPGMERLPQFPSIICSPTQPSAIAIFNDQPLPIQNVNVPIPAGGVAVQAIPQATATPAISVPAILPVGEFVEGGADNFWTLGPGGQVVRRIQTPPNPAFGVLWNKDGSKWYAALRNRKTRAITTQELDASGKFNLVTAELYVAPKEQPAELAIQTKPMFAKLRKVKRGFNNLWLSSPRVTSHPDVLVTPNGLDAQLSPSHDAVFYVEGGIAKVRALVALSDDQRRGLYQALRQEALSDAKQVGLGLQMYSSDYDDVLPGADAFDGIYPYMKNQDIMDGFTYTPPADLGTANMSNPAGTPLGYVDAPGGRAVVYGDGHAVWQPNP